MISVDSRQRQREFAEMLVLLALDVGVGVLETRQWENVPGGGYWDGRDTVVDGRDVGDVVDDLLSWWRPFAALRRAARQLGVEDRCYW